MTNASEITVERRADAPAISRSASLNPATWDATNRTIEVVWTTGARGARFDWDNLRVIEEELSTEATSVRLQRLNSGAPVLNAHGRGDLSSQIGVVVPGSAKMVSGQGVALLRLSNRPEIASIVDDVAAGIIRNISVGYVVHVWEVEERNGTTPVWRAIDWEPTEISFVPVPFDPAAQVRATTDLHPCIIRQKGKAMTTPATISTTTDDNVNTHQRGDTNTPSGSAASITELRRYFDMLGETGELGETQRASLILEAAERGLSMTEVRSMTVRMMGDRQRQQTGPLAFHSGGDQTFDNPQFHARAIEDALYARMSGAAPSSAAREFMGMSMVQIAGAMLERSGRGHARNLSPTDILSAAAWNGNGTRAGSHGYMARAAGMMTTSDFPELLTGAGQRFLMDVFAAAGSPLKLVARRRWARDFRAISGIELSGFGTLQEVQEAGEIKHGSFKSRKESYALKTYAKQFGLSRQAIINDDLGAFGDPIRSMARSAAETEAALFAKLVASNPTMADGSPLFDAVHGNLAPAADTGKPVGTNISNGRIAMRRQKDLDGVTPLATAPKFIVTGPDLETWVEQLLSETISPARADDANPFAGKLTPLVEPRFDGPSWYLFADPSLSPVLEYAYLDDLPGPHIETRDGWDVLGTEFRVYMDFGAGAVDWRGGFKNTGATG